MIKLLPILNEVFGGPRAIILSGASGVGKSEFTKVIKPHIPADFQEFNPDTFSPDDDPKKPNVSKNSAAIRKQAIPNAIAGKQNFIYDTTGQNYNETAKVIFDAQQAGYKVMMVMLYASPIVTFLRNFGRERKVEKSGVLTSWAKVYGLIESYSKIPNLEFVLVQTPITPEETQQVKEFEQAYSGNELEEYFRQLVGSDPAKYASSFRKTDTKDAADLPSPDELKAKEEKKKQSEDRWKKAIDYIKDQFKTVEKYIKILKPVNYEGALGAIKSFAKP